MENIEKTETDEEKLNREVEKLFAETFWVIVVLVLTFSPIVGAAIIISLLPK
jgi:hypothetical protein